MALKGIKDLNEYHSFLTDLALCAAYLDSQSPSRNNKCYRLARENDQVRQDWAEDIFYLELALPVSGSSKSLHISTGLSHGPFGNEPFDQFIIQPPYEIANTEIIRAFKTMPNCTAEMHIGTTGYDNQIRVSGFDGLLQLTGFIMSVTKFEGKAGTIDPVALDDYAAMAAKAGNLPTLEKLQPIPAVLVRARAAKAVLVPEPV